MLENKPAKESLAFPCKGIVASKKGKAFLACEDVSMSQVFDGNR